MKNRILLKINKGVIPVFVVFFVAFFLLYATFSMNGVDNNSYTRLSEMKVDVKHEDGTVDSFNSNMFNFQSKNDKITMHLPLDEKLRKENQSINFFFYASVVKAYYKDKLLVSYGEDVKRHMIGHLKILIPVPMEAYGDEIRVEIQPTMDFMEDTFHFPVLMPIQNALFFPVLGKETSFSFFYMVLIGTFFAIAFLACQYFLQDYAKEGFWMMILINSIIAWYMGNTGMIYAVNANEDFNAIVEYIGMYMLFFSAPLFASYETVRPFRSICTLSYFIFTSDRLYFCKISADCAGNPDCYGIFRFAKPSLSRKKSSEHGRIHYAIRIDFCVAFWNLGTNQNYLCNKDYRGLSAYFAVVCGSSFFQVALIYAGIDLPLFLRLQGKQCCAENFGRKESQNTRLHG